MKRTHMMALPLARFAFQFPVLKGLRDRRKQVEVFNVGLEDPVDVKTVAKVVIEEMG
jgi:hypothetical protein